MLFSFILLSASFGVHVSAADTTNLVDPNLLNWNTTDPNNVSVQLKAKDVYRIYYTRIPLSDTSELGVRAGAVYSLTNLTAGNSYTFNIDLMGVQQIKDSGALQGDSLTAATYYAPLTNYNGELLIGLASYDSTTGSFDTVADGSFVKINGSNYKEYFSKTLTISFTLPNVVNPCIVISYMDLEASGNNCFWYFRNISLIDNEEAKEDGFLAKLIDAIIGIFVPDEQFLINFKEQISLLFSDSFGFIYDILIFITDFLTQLGDMLNNNFNDNFSFTLPGQEFDFLGYHIKLWDDITLSFDFLNTIPGFVTLYNLYKVFLHAWCIFILFAYAEHIYKEIMDSK